MPSASPLKNFRLTDHARLEMARRQISETEIAQILSAPEQTENVGSSRRIFQSRVVWGKTGKTYLLRVIVEIDRQPPEIVTV
ncbi:MAG: DUF4258 domain-containing protein [Chloroflexi bacterium]|nr:DUF4258 domain-containing protein [Chloroflexota bacterium]